MNDLIAKLRNMSEKKYSADWSFWVQTQCAEAADRIEQLEREKAELDARATEYAHLNDKQAARIASLEKENFALAAGQCLCVSGDEGGNLYCSAQRKIAELEKEKANEWNAAIEAAVKICDEMAVHYAAYKDTALLNGDIDLSNAASGEPRAAEFLAGAIRALAIGRDK